MSYEIDCDECGYYAEGTNCKQVCIHCYNAALKENRRLRKLLKKLEEKNGENN